MEKQRKYGLIGFPLSHSFSKRFFSEKFKSEGLAQCSYELFPLENIHQLPHLLASEPNLCGLNVTIPYKQAVLPFMDKLQEDAQAIGAVNVIRLEGSKLIGYNSDAYGFEISLMQFLGKNNLHKSDIQALILGTGGASLAVRFVLERIGFPYRYVSRKKMVGEFTYSEVTPEVMRSHRLVVNCTPLGTYPNEDTFPELPYQAVTGNHFFYDLVYNPAETLFLKNARLNGASTMNGLTMLHLQAERSWDIWNKK